MQLLRLLPTHVNSKPHALQLAQVQPCATLMLTSVDDVITLAYAYHIYIHSMHLHRVSAPFINLSDSSNTGLNTVLWHILPLLLCGWAQ
jgi:hypothetical protein